MEATLPVGPCLEHPERTGAPCARCGTFRCEECLVDGTCPPCRQAHGAHPPLSGETYGFSRRALARLIDVGFGYGAGLLAGVVAAFAMVLLQLVGLVDAGWLERFGHGTGFNILAGNAASLAGTVVGTWFCGATVGKVILGMRVLGADGQRAGLRANLVRELGYYVDALFFGLVAKNAMDSSVLNQRYGDAWAQTVVVRASSLHAPVSFSTGRLAGGIALGLGAEVVVLAAFFVLGAL